MGADRPFNQLAGRTIQHFGSDFVLSFQHPDHHSLAEMSFGSARLQSFVAMHVAAFPPM